MQLFDLNFLDKNRKNSIKYKAFKKNFIFIIIIFSRLSTHLVRIVQQVLYKINEKI